MAIGSSFVEIVPAAFTPPIAGGVLPEGVPCLQWSFDSLSVEAGGYDADFVFLRRLKESGHEGSSLSIQGPAVLDLLIERAAKASRRLLFPVGALDVVLAQMRAAQTHRQDRRKHGWVVGGGLLAIVLILGALLWNLPNLVAMAVPLVPTSVDRSIGDLTAGAMNSQFGAPLEEAEVQQFVDAIADKFKAHVPGDFDYRVTVVDSNEVNAFALPGGRMVVFSGLIRRAESAEQVAGVLAHEFSHVTLRHSMRQLARAATLNVLLGVFLGDASAIAQLGGEVAAQLRSNAFGRSEEAAADAEGVRLMLRCNLDPNGIVGFFESMQRDGNNQLPDGLSWLSDHPQHQERIDALREQIGNNHPAPDAALNALFERAKSELTGVPSQRRKNGE